MEAVLSDIAKIILDRPSDYSNIESESPQEERNVANVNPQSGEGKNEFTIWDREYRIVSR